MQNNQHYLSHNVHNQTCNAGDYQSLCNMSSKMADEFTNIRGQSSYPQVTTQHNRGGGIIFNQKVDSKRATVTTADHHNSQFCKSNMATLQYTNWCQISSGTANHVHIVYSDGNGQLQRGFFYIVSDEIFGSGRLYHCDTFPVEHLVIIHTQNMLIHCPLKVQEVTELEKVNAAITADNFKQDCRTFNSLGMSYEKYMDRIIMNLIENQDKSTHNMSSKVRPRDNSVVLNIVDGVDTEPTHYTDTPPQFFKNFGDLSNLSSPKNYNDPDKDRGFISLQETDFKFIGPDRDFCNYDNIEQVTKIGDMIRATGLPNYKQARFPIKSNLNLPAWEKYLADYPDQRIYQYLKFGFPLSLTDPDAIHNTSISNHFSALQYPQAIQQYLDKEKAFGAIIGPFSDIPSDKFHCSPMLTRPKDIDKRRVILNLSYPKGHSLNDNVDKQLFDGKKFILKFPTIDDICNEICNNPNEILMSKIDISRAFRNLRVDPGDAIKFGLSWNGQYYQDLAVAFGWIHGSGSFQLVADVITHIMKQKGFKTFAYIDDFILINHKSKAKQAFDTLTDLLQELGLPMNDDKRTPPTRTLTCLGICINLDTNTLSIDAEKIAAIYDHCVNTLTKTTISKKHLQSLLGKLLYLHKCVKPARIFVNRILATFRQDCCKNKFRITTEMSQDLNWFIRFLHQFNGKAILVKNPIQQPHTLHIDASLTGLGGVWGNRVYSTPIYPFPTFETGIVHWIIGSLEAFTSTILL